MRSITERFALLAVVGLARSVAAQPADPTKRTEAQSLYDEGRRLYNASDYANACPKFEASLRIDPEDLDAQGLLAFCNERRGHLATAWTLFRQLRSNAQRRGRTDQAEIADSHVKSLEPRLAWLTLTVKTRPVGLVVKRNGVEVPPDAFDIPIALDRGEYVLSAEAPGYPTWRFPLKIEDGQKPVVDVELTKLTAKPPTLAPAALRSPQVEPEPRQTAPSRSPGGWIGIAATGAGVVAVGVAGVMGLSARSKRDDARSLGCTADLTMCPAEALDEANSSHTRGQLATGFFVAGVALATAGTVLWVAVPRKSSSSKRAWRVVPSVGTRDAHVMIDHHF